MKKQKIQLIIMLAFLLVFVSGYFGLKTYNKKAEAKKSEPRYTAFTISDKDNVTELKVTNTNGEFNFVKNGDEWKLSDDDTIDVDEDTISEKIDKLTQITSDQAIEKPENLSDYGLEEPALVITLTLADGSVHTIKIGDYNSSAYKYYLSVDESDIIYTVDSTIHTGFEFTTEQITKVAEDTSEAETADDETAKEPAE